MIIRRREKTIRSGIALSRTIRSWKTESRNTGSKITGRIRTIRSGKNESRNSGSKITQCHLLQCLAPTLAPSQNAIMIFICLLLLFRLVYFNVIIMVYFVGSMFYLSSLFPHFLWLPKCTTSSFLTVMTTWSDLTTSDRQNYTLLPMRALNASACSYVHGCT